MGPSFRLPQSGMAERWTLGVARRVGALAALGGIARNPAAARKLRSKVGCFGDCESSGLTGLTRQGGVGN